MWIVFKYNHQEYDLLKENLKQKIDKNIQHNIILHLKCPLTTEDNNNIIIPTDYNPIVNTIAAYNINTNSKLSNSLNN